jgi:hypothetical protein
VKRFERKHTDKGFVYLGVGLCAQYPDPLIPLIHFYEKSDHESDSSKNFGKKGSKGSGDQDLDAPAPPPGQGSEEVRAGSRHSVDTRLWYRGRARELLREVGTPAELSTNLDAFTTDKLIEFVEWLEGRQLAAQGVAVNGSSAAPGAPGA